jgi:rhodanese-related sulfurtransferase
MIFPIVPMVLAAAVGASDARAAAAPPAFPPAVGEWIAAAKKQVKLIDPKNLKAILDQGVPLLLIDVREADEFESGHLPGAVNIPRGVIEFRIWPLIGYPDRADLGAKIILYCGSGARCALAAKSLQELGFNNVFSADMALKDWAAAGYPLEK